MSKRRKKKAKKKAPCRFAPPAGAFLDLPESAGSGGLGAIILPVPYEATTTYGKGTRNGPAAIIAASSQVELYDAELGGEPAACRKIRTLPALEADAGSPEASVEKITEHAAEQARLCQSEKAVLVGLGGEHTVSVGLARGVSRVHRDLLVVQLDAHADLRESYEDSPYSHACTARRILEFAPVVQLGIRSLSQEEAEFMRSAPEERLQTFFADEMKSDPSWPRRLAERVRGRTVYLTIDVDCLDPSIMPATGTPEPGGLSWEDVLTAVRTIAKESDVVGFDCVELAPVPGMHAPDFLAAKLVYKTLSLIWTAPQGFRLPG